MTGIQFNVTVEGELGTDALRFLYNAFDDLTPLMERVGAALVAGTRERFRDQTGPNGIPWKPSERAIEEGGKTTLLDSNALRDGINYWAAPDHVLIGSPTVYGAVHQLGAATGSLGVWVGNDKAGRERTVLSPWGNIPARPFLGISDEDEVEISALTEQFFSELLGSLS